MLFLGCFQSRWHHRSLIVIENGSSFETWRRFLGLNRGWELGVASPMWGSWNSQGFPPIIVHCWGWCHIFWPLVQKKSGRKLVYNGWWTHWRSQRHTRALATAATWPVMKQCLGGWEGGDGDWSGPCDYICMWTLYIHNDFYTFFFFGEKYVARPKVNGSKNASYCRAAFF